MNVIPFPRYARKRRMVEIVKYVGPFAAGSALIGAISDAGGRVTRFGPYTDRKMWPKFDNTRFLIHAEIPVDEVTT